MSPVLWKSAAFDELNRNELYRILDIRNRVFMLEQKVDCPDLDYKDQQAVHLQGYVGNALVAYCRIFLPGTNREAASIGRVAVEAGYRGLGYGRKLMEKALEITGNRPVNISAQLYLEDFYHSLGFETVGDPYNEAGIPHVKMNKK